jgi:hypothetical protein
MESFLTRFDLMNKSAEVMYKPTSQQPFEGPQTIL